MIHTTHKTDYKYTKLGRLPGDISIHSQAKILERNTTYVSDSFLQTYKSCALFRKEFYERAQKRWRMGEEKQIETELADEED